MNRQQFMNTLRRELAKLPAGEVGDILDYYEEYFDEAGVENEEAVIRELGSPVKIASQMKANYAVKQIDSKKNKKGGISAIWLVILGVLAAPVALPMALVVVAVLFSIVAVIISLAFAALLTIGAIFVVGIVLVGVGIASIGLGLGGSLIGIGCGLALIGIMLLSAFVVIVVVKETFNWLAKTVNRQRQKRVLNKEIQARRAVREAEKQGTTEKSNVEMTPETDAEAAANTAEQTVEKEETDHA